MLDYSTVGKARGAPHDLLMEQTVLPVVAHIDHGERRHVAVESIRLAERALVRLGDRGVLVLPAAGPSNFDLPVSTPPPAPSEGPGPPPLKTKTNVGYVRYARRRRIFGGLEAQDVHFP